MDAATFFTGMLACGLVLLAGDLVHRHIEAQLRIRAARRRVSRLVAE